MVLLGDGHEAPEKPQHAVVPVVGLPFAAVATKHAKTREDQERAEHEHEPGEGREQGGTREHENRSEHDRAYHAVEEDVVAVALWYGEAGEDHAEHEDVVQREALLQQVGGEVRFGPLHASQIPYEPPEGEGDSDPEHRQPQRFLERYLSRVPVEHEEVEDEQREHESEEHQPRPQRERRSHHYPSPPLAPSSGCPPTTITVL